MLFYTTYINFVWQFIWISSVIWNLEHTTSMQIGLILTNIPAKSEASGTILVHPIFRQFAFISRLPKWPMWMVVKTISKHRWRCFAWWFGSRWFRRRRFRTSIVALLARLENKTPGVPEKINPWSGWCNPWNICYA